MKNLLTSTQKRSPALELWLECSLVPRFSLLPRYRYSSSSSGYSTSGDGGTERSSSRPPRSTTGGRIRTGRCSCCSTADGGSGFVGFWAGCGGCGCNWNSLWFGLWLWLGRAFKLGMIWLLASGGNVGVWLARVGDVCSAGSLCFTHRSRIAWRCASWNCCRRSCSWRWRCCSACCSVCCCCSSRFSSAPASSAIFCSFSRRRSVVGRESRSDRKSNSCRASCSCRRLTKSWRYGTENGNRDGHTNTQIQRERDR